MLQHWIRDRESSGILALGTGLALVGVATAAISLAMDGAHDGRIAGNEAMAIAGVWGLGGLLMAAVERRYPGHAVRHGARGLVAAGLVYLVMGALLGNARWAVPAMRLFGYVGAMGSTWATELLLLRREPESDVNGLLSMTAAGVGYFVCAFEVVRWLTPVFTLPPGQMLTPQIYAWQESTRVFITTSLWAVYGLITMVAGRRLGSPQTRLLSSLMLAIALGYAAAKGLTNLTAELTLQVGAVALLTAASLAAAQLARHSPGERMARERLVTWLLTLGAIAFPTVWAALRLL